jgi:hypothetical protein
MMQWTESPGIRRRPPLFGNWRRQSHPVVEPRALRNRQDLPSYIKNSPPVYDLAEEAQWVATIFR